MRWKIVMQIWPHSTGNGASLDRAAVGGGDDHYFYVDAPDINAAMQSATLIETGIRTNPMVWMVNVTAICVHTDADVALPS